MPGLKQKFLRFAGQEGDSQEAADPSTEPQTGGGFRLIRRIATGQYNLPAILVSRNVEDLDREVGPRFHVALPLNGSRSPLSMRQTRKLPILVCVRSSLAVQGGVQYKTKWSCVATTRCGACLAYRKAFEGCLSAHLGRSKHGTTRFDRQMARRSTQLFATSSHSGGFGDVCYSRLPHSIVPLAPSDLRWHVGISRDHRASCGMRGDGHGRQKQGHARVLVRSPPCR